MKYGNIHSERAAPLERSNCENKTKVIIQMIIFFNDYCYLLNSSVDDIYAGYIILSF